MAKKRSAKKVQPPVVVDEIHPIVERRLSAIDVAIHRCMCAVEAQERRIEQLAARPPAVTRRDGRGLRNAGAMAGLSAIGAGCWLIHPALACVVLGVILFAGSIAGMIAQTGRTKPKDS